jgi:hypothetical protein
MAGRTGLTQAMIQRIASRIRSGVWWVGEAVVAEGYRRSAHYEWLRKGAEGIEPYAAYKTEIERARADLEATMLERMGELSSCGDSAVELNALKWRLEKLNHKRYGNRVDAVPDPVDEAYEGMSDDEMVSQLASDPRIVEAVRKRLEGE